MSDEKTPKNNTFTRLIFTSGQPRDMKLREEINEFFGIDGKVGFSDNDVKEMFFNTRRLMRNNNHLVNVKIGHDDDDERQKGQVTKLELVKTQLPSGVTGNGIRATFKMNEPFIDDVENGLFPNVSIEFDDQAVNDKGDDIGLLLDAFALLGTSQPAIMHLPTGLAKQYSKLKQFQATRKNETFSKSKLKLLRGKKSMFFNKREKAEKERITAEDYDAMREISSSIENAADSIKEKAGADVSEELDALDIAASKIRELADKGQEIESDDEADESKEQSKDEADDERADDNPKDKEEDDEMDERGLLQKEINDLRKDLKRERLEKEQIRTAEKKAKADEVFNDLHAKECVLAEDRELFDTIANAHGLDRARDNFLRSTKATPATGDALTNSDDTKGTDKNDTALFEKMKLGYSRSLNVSDDVAEKMATEAVKAQKRLQGAK